MNERNLYDELRYALLALREYDRGTLNLVVSDDVPAPQQPTLNSAAKLHRIGVDSQAQAHKNRLQRVLQ